MQYVNGKLSRKKKSAQATVLRCHLKISQQNRVLGSLYVTKIHYKCAQNLDDIALMENNKAIYALEVLPLNKKCY